MKIKTIFLLVIVISIAAVLVACGGSSNAAGSSNTSGSTTGTSDTSNQTGTSLSKVNSLLVGSLKLDGTDNEISADEAAKILPLWQAYRLLSSSQTAAEADVDGLLKQIESTMTSAQVTAIEEMNLTSTDMLDLMQTLGPGMSPQGTPDPNSTPDFSQGGMVFQDGTPPDGFNGSGQGGSTSGSSGGSGSVRQNPPSGGMAVGGGPGGDAGSAAGLNRDTWPG